MDRKGRGLPCAVHKSRREIPNPDVHALEEARNMGEMAPPRKDGMDQLELWGLTLAWVCCGPWGDCITSLSLRFPTGG